MRNLVVAAAVGGAAALTAATIYSGITNTPPDSTAAPDAPSVASTQLDRRFAALERSLAEIASSGAQRSAQEAHQLGRLDRTLRALDSRLGEVESGLAEVGAEVAATAAQRQAEEEEEAAKRAARPAVFSDGQFGGWIDRSLSLDQYDEARTGAASDAAVASLEAALPDVYLEEMQCAESYCRATFSHENGERPRVEALFGRPPFMNEGFTLPREDGSVAVYFTEPGQSLDELREFARGDTG